MLQPPPSVFIKARRRFRSKYIYMCSLHKSTSCGVNCPRCSDRVQGRTMFSGPRGAVGLCRSAGITIRRLIQRHLEYNIGQIQHVLEAGDGDDLNNIPPSHTSSRTATKPRTKTHKRKPLFSNPSPPPPIKNRPLCTRTHEKVQRHVTRRITAVSTLLQQIQPQQKPRQTGNETTQAEEPPNFAVCALEAAA